MAIGYLRVETRVAFEAVPVLGARIEYFVNDALVTTNVTDASGVAPIVSFDAPERELSLDPDYTGLPYSVCSIRVTANRYRVTNVQNIQILAGETAIQPVELEPIDITSAPTQRVPLVVSIPSHPLASGEAWHAAEYEECSSPQILDRVVIPQYIRVHLGRPNSSASNVSVTFPNYIKNVCCSEIYSTWPENAIRANIYCQISLALNRIFTEWYPSRGYNFDITNSTQYDQYYVHGRNIYQNISNIVDGIFNNYIRRPDNLEPFYAEYCNGTTATCPGLKQWGTVTLAQQGYTPIGILQYYYGTNIGIYTAETVVGTVSSYPGTALRVGSTGSSVTTIQTQLLRIRRNYPLIPNLGTADGIFGSGTQSAVRTFQQIFSLTADGVVGKATWYKISYIYAAVLKLAELTSEGIPVPATRPTAVLRTGSTGELVSVAQYFLTLAARYYDTLYPIAIDGIFGNGTKNAVEAFQSLRGITSDGIIGPDTWTQLYQVYYSVFDAIVSPSVPYPGVVLQSGSSGNSVATMQRMLNVIGVFFPSITALTIDGKFGPATTSAVRTYQSLFGLAVDGKIGPATWSSIVNTYDSLIV